MTLCPIALAVGCRRCFAVSCCPLKGVLGDYKKEAETEEVEAEATPAGSDADAQPEEPQGEAQAESESGGDAE